MLHKPIILCKLHDNEYVFGVNRENKFFLLWLFEWCDIFLYLSSLWKIVFELSVSVDNVFKEIRDTVATFFSGNLFYDPILRHFGEAFPVSQSTIFNFGLSDIPTSVKI